MSRRGQSRKAASTKLSHTGIGTTGHLEESGKARFNWLIERPEHYVYMFHLQAVRPTAKQEFLFAAALNMADRLSGMRCHVFD